MALAAGLITASPAAAATACSGADALPGSISGEVLEQATLCLLNEQRSNAGLKPLKPHAKLDLAAVRFSQAMVQQQFFNHVSPQGSTLGSRIKQVSYTKGAKRWFLGENIGWGTGSRSTPAKMVDAWMNSAGHKRNILDPAFKEIGIGVVLGAPVATAASASTGATYTTDFGARS
ncbi:MAG: CAP domain-containing protein [Patulibacter sp.]